MVSMRVGHNKRPTSATTSSTSRTTRSTDSNSTPTTPTNTTTTNTATTTTSKTANKTSPTITSSPLTTSYISLLLILLVVFNLVLHSANAQRAFYHSECGDSPVVKYKELAKTIGNLFWLFVLFLLLFGFVLRANLIFKINF